MHMGRVRDREHAGQLVLTEVRIDEDDPLDTSLHERLRQPAHPRASQEYRIAVTPPAHAYELVRQEVVALDVLRVDPRQDVTATRGDVHEAQPVREHELERLARVRDRDVADPLDRAPEPLELESQAMQPRPQIPASGDGIHTRAGGVACRHRDQQQRAESLEC